MNIRAQQTTTVRSQNSWYLKTGYIHNFICRCGLVDQYTCSILGHAYHPDHTCSACGNRCFLDAVMFLENKKVTRWSRFCWSIEKIKTDKAWIVRTVASIPLFDYALQKIHIRKVIFATGTLGFDGEYIYKEEEPAVLNKYVHNHRDEARQIRVLMQDDLAQGICDLIREYPIETIVWLEREKMVNFSPREQLKVYSFFLKVDHLKEFDFYYCRSFDNFAKQEDIIETITWLKKENIIKFLPNERSKIYAFFLKYDHLKEFDFYSWRYFEDFATYSKKYPTVKKMLGFISNHYQAGRTREIFFESYRNAIERGSYNPVAEYLFFRYVKDHGLLQKLISVDTDTKNTLFDGLYIRHLEMFFIFFLEQYGEKGPTKLFSSLIDNDFGDGGLIRGTLLAYRKEKETFIKEHFIKVSPDFRSLHDEFVRISCLRYRCKNQGGYVWNT